MKDEEKKLVENIAYLKDAWKQVGKIRSDCSVLGISIFSEYQWKEIVTHYGRELNELRLKLSVLRGE